MATLTIRRGAQTFETPFSGVQRLSVLLEQAGQMLASPCGGRGVCGKCAVLLEGAVAPANAAERRCGVRLACQAVIEGDAMVILPDVLPMQQIETGGGIRLPSVQPMPGCVGAAVDVGTTTLALRLYDLRSGESLAAASLLNPQTTVAADVIGRIDAAMNGRLKDLTASIAAAIGTLLSTACAQAACSPDAVESLVITGNTTMLYLLAGREPTCLSRAPFEADCLFGEEYILLGRRAYLPDCLHAFVGADTTCALLASGLLDREETALLVDVGTNGEIALWHDGRLYIASTAAGPAFEGAGICCGCGSVPGAIDRVWTEAGAVCVHTISGARAVGLCGSGLVDAAAVLLEMEIIDETGAMDDDCELAPGVTLTQRDVRALQLAKAAIAAGTDSLLHAAGCSISDVTTVCLAGGFGSHLDVHNAARIGLIAPEFTDRVRVIGNAALDGAAMLLLDGSLRARSAAIRRQAQHVRLDGNAYFSQRYVEAMLFGDEE